MLVSPQSCQLLRRGLAALALAALLAACDSIGIGVGIPYTPIAVGTSIPLHSKSGAGAGAAASASGASAPKSRDAVFRMVHVDSLPSGARILVNGELVGSTPMDVALPFARGWFGHARGAVNVVVEKEGFAPAGTPVFPASGGLVSIQPGGAPQNRVELQLVRK